MSAIGVNPSFCSCESSRDITYLSAIADSLFVQIGIKQSSSFFSSKSFIDSFVVMPPLQLARGATWHSDLVENSIHGN